MKDVQAFLLALVLVYIGIVVILYLMQWYFFYHPERLPLHFRFRYPDPFREVLIPCPSGLRVSGLLFTAPESKGVVLYFKGNTRSIKGWSRFRADFLRHGFDFFIFDYPGFGKSSGHARQKDIFEASEAVYQWLCQRYPEARIVIYGRSLGGGFAARVAALFHPAMLILEAPYYSVEKLAAYYTRIVPVRLILRLHIPVHHYLLDVTCPVHILHGTGDRIIPFRFSEELAREQPVKVILHPVEGASHNNLLRFPAYFRALEIVLKKAVP